MKKIWKTKEKFIPWNQLIAMKKKENPKFTMKKLENLLKKELKKTMSKKKNMKKIMKIMFMK